MQLKKIAIRATIVVLICGVLLAGCSKVVVDDLEAQQDEETKSEDIYCKHDDPSQIVVVTAEAPTCHKEGLTEGMKCNLCGVMVMPQTVVPTIECVRSGWIVGEEANETKDGYEYIKCTMCGKILETNIIYAGSQGLSYAQRVDGKYCQVSGIGSCQDADLVIPTMYNGMPVQRINDGAFSGCASIKSIVIPEGVIAIGHKAFWDCSSLESITIPHSVGRIDGIAFTGCTSLSNIYFDGTQNEWNRIGKNTGWNICSSKVTIHCTDGEISN